MAESIVINTGPLVALAKADLLDIIAELPHRFVCPRQVREELDAGAASGHLSIGPTWLDVLDLKRPIDPIARSVLDPGEAAVIQLACEEGIDTVSIDERKGRRLAVASGLRVVGSLGLILKCKVAGLILALRPHLDKLESAGIWYDKALRQAVLDAAGE